jgi:putative nucleotidyltransferase with HDIG domain
LWEHSLATAAAANLVAGRLELSDREEISTAALLHDIGKVVIKIHLKDDYERLLATCKEKRLLSFEAEREAFGTDHAEVGKWLAESWFLPEKLIEPIACHHDIEKSVTHRTRTAVVHFADVLIRARGFGGNELVPQVHPLAVSILRLDNMDVDSLFAELDDLLLEVKNFSMDIQEQQTGHV